MAAINLSAELKYWIFNMLSILYVLQVMVPLASCELVQALFDPETKQVYYNPTTIGEYCTTYVYVAIA